MTEEHLPWSHPDSDPMKDIRETAERARKAAAEAWGDRLREDVMESLQRFRAANNFPPDSPITADLMRLAQPDMRPVAVQARRVLENVNEQLREMARQYALQDVKSMELLFKARVGGRQNGKSLPGVWMDEAQRLAPKLGTVEHVAAKYATAPNDDWNLQWDRAAGDFLERAGIVHQAEHYGFDYRGNQR